MLHSCPFPLHGKWVAAVSLSTLKQCEAGHMRSNAFIELATVNYGWCSPITTIIVAAAVVAIIIITVIIVTAVCPVN